MYSEEKSMVAANAHPPTIGAGQTVLMSYKSAPGQARRKLARDDDSRTAAD
jgi:hypothetical protein